jgi:hypothetical protein
MRAERSSRRRSSSATRVGFGPLRLRGGAGICEEHGLRSRWHLETGLAVEAGEVKGPMGEGYGVRRTLEHNRQRPAKGRGTWRGPFQGKA